MFYIVINCSTLGEKIKIKGRLVVVREPINKLQIGLFGLAGYYFKKKDFSNETHCKERLWTLREQVNMVWSYGKIKAVCE